MAEPPAVRGDGERGNVGVPGEVVHVFVGGGAVWRGAGEARGRGGFDFAEDYGGKRLGVDSEEVSGTMSAEHMIAERMSAERMSGASGLQVICASVLSLEVLTLSLTRVQ